MAAGVEKIQILFLGSSPADQDQLALTKELNELSRQLARERFVVESRWGEPASKLPDLLDEYRPQVLHFSGHGSTAGELLFTDEDGRSHAPDPAALAKVFAQIQGRVRCVVLNACYSAAQAERIAEHVDVVIGMSDALADADARAFTRAFYKALGDGRSVQWAFERAQLKLELDGGHEFLRLLPGRGPTPNEIILLPEPREPPEYVFVAHMPGDKLLVLRLCRELIAAGVRPWLDIWELPPHADRRADMREALRRAPAVVICQGPRGSGADNEEYGAALGQRLAADPITVHRIELNDDGWLERVHELADTIGPDDDGEAWMRYETRRAGSGELQPYRGLEAFRERDARWMFGRDEELAGLLERIANSETRFLTVIGASGSGKSSLVMAGLCPLLRGRSWKLAYLRPGKRPCEALATALIQLQAEPGAAVDYIGDADKIRVLREQLLGGTDQLRLLLGRMCSADEAKILIVVDQLEELLTEAGHGPDAQAFLANLIEATHEFESLRVVATLRADFFPRCLELPDLGKVLEAGAHIVLPPMQAEQIRSAVELPARRVGHSLARGLADELVAGAAGQPGRLPLLQHVLRELWVRRDMQRRVLTRAAHDEVGGLEGAIAAAADRALDRLKTELGSQPAVIATRRVMMRLVHLGETAAGDTRHRATLADLGGDVATARVLEAFVEKARVLVASESGGEEVFEIAHEALLREWATLVGWLDKNRGALRLRQELERAAEEFAATNANPEYLWGKGRVTEARRVLEESTLELNAVERRFLEASEAAVRVHEQKVKKRRNTIRAMTAGAFVVLAGFLVAVSWLAVENRRQADENQQLATSERALREKTDTALRGQKGLSASLLAESRRTGEALLVAIDAAGAAGSDGSRPAMLPEAYQGLIDVISRDDLIGEVAIATLEGHSDSVGTARFSPDGTHIATGSSDGTARLWDAASGTTVTVFAGHSDAVADVAFSPDGTRIATASSDGTARLWDTDSGKPLFTLTGNSDFLANVVFSPDGTRITAITAAGFHGIAHSWDATSGTLRLVIDGDADEFVHTMAFSPDGTRISTTTNRTARLWDVASGKLLFALEDYPAAGVDVSPDNTRVAVSVSIDGPGGIELFDVSSGKLISALPDHSANVVTFSPDGSRIATGGLDNTLRLWDVSSGKLLSSFVGHPDWVTDVVFSPNGDRIASVSKGDHIARLWDVASAQLIAKFEGHSDQVSGVAFSPDGTRIVTTSSDHTARLWDVGPNKILPKFEGNAVAFSPDGTRIATANRDGTASSWNVASGQLIAKLEGHTESVTDVSFSPNGTLIATASDDDTARLWDAFGKPLATLQGHDFAVNVVAFSPDSTQVVTVSKDGTARLWDASGKPLATLGADPFLADITFSPDGSRIVAGSYETVDSWDASGKPLASLEGHVSNVWAIAFSPDGTRMVSVGADETALLWDVVAGKRVSTLEGHSDSIRDVAFSPDGTRIATASDDHTIRSWDASGKHLATFEGHVHAVYAVAFSPDGTRIATGGSDHAVRLWNVASGQLIAALEGHASTVHEVEFSPDGTRIATASLDGTVILWPIPELALELACRAALELVAYDRVAEICDPLLAAN